MLQSNFLSCIIIKLSGPQKHFLKSYSELPLSGTLGILMALVRHNAFSLKEANAMLANEHNLT
jgi:hypothetical protein